MRQCDIEDSTRDNIRRVRVAERGGGLPHAFSKRLVAEDALGLGDEEMRCDIFFLDDDSRASACIGVGIGALIVAHGLGYGDDDGGFLPETYLGDRAGARSRYDDVSRASRSLHRILGKIAERMIPRGMPILGEYDLRYRLDIRLIVRAGLVYDRGEGDQVREGREDGLIDAGRALGAAENEDGRDMLLEIQVLSSGFAAFRLDTRQGLPNWYAGASYLRTGLLREIGGGTLEGSGNLGGE